MRRGKKGRKRERESEKARKDVSSNDAREKKREDAAREKPTGRVRVKKREREKGRLAEGRENPGREGGRAGIVAPCLA